VVKRARELPEQEFEGGRGLGELLLQELVLVLALGLLLAGVLAQAQVQVQARVRVQVRTVPEAQVRALEPPEQVVQEQR